MASLWGVVAGIVRFTDGLLGRNVVEVDSGRIEGIAVMAG